MQVMQILLPGDFYWCLGRACGLEGIPFDLDRVRRRFPPPHSLATLLLAATDLGMRATVSEVQSDALTSPSPPCFVLLNGVAEGSGSVYAVAQVTESDAEGVRLLHAGPTTQVPIYMHWAGLRETFAGAIIRFARLGLPQAESMDQSQPTFPIFGWSWFVPELLRYRRIWRDVLLASLAIQLAALAMPLFSQVIIDKVVVHQTLSTLYIVAIALFALMLFSAGMSWIRQYLVLHTGNRVDAVLGARVFEHLLALPVRYFDLRPAGTVLARLQGVETIREFVSGAAVALLLDLPFMLLFVAIMFWYSWLLALLVLGGLTALIMLSLSVVPAIRTRLNRQFLAGSRNQAFVTEYLTGMETVKSLQMEPRLKSRYHDLLASYLAASFDARRLSGTYGVLAALIEQMMTLTVLIAGAWMVMQGEGFTIGMLVAFQMFSSRLSQPLLRMAGLWQEFQHTAIAVQRLGDVMNTPAEPDTLVPNRPSSAKTVIEFSAVSFRHAENLPYLYRDFNFRLEAGECVALMGPSGCGKSTLARLLLGTYMPTDGRILVNGCDTRGMPVSELRAHFGVVLQDTRLFSGTLHENLAAANPLAVMNDMVRACRLAEIHDFIERLPEGYQTCIGEHGVGLSGGQKQRLAIARALLRQPRVLIFDEASSNLDVETAENIGRTVSRLKGGMSVLFIAHQLPASLQVDRVFSLNGATA